MSDTDSFIDEVTEELRRDQLFKTMRRYGWIAILLIVLIVGGAAFAEYRKAQARAQAEATGDAMLAALTAEDPAARATALGAIDPALPEAAVVVGFLKASEQAEAGDIAGAVASLDAIALSQEITPMYQQIARFKALTLQTETMSPADLRIGFEAMAQPGAPLRMLAQEQLALLDLAGGDSEAAIAGYQSILNDAEVTADLQQRALQVIVALGGEPDLAQFSGAGSPTGNGN